MNGSLQRADFSGVPDGPCEHIAALLPREALLACRLVCRSWRRSFSHALSPLSLDTRFFAAGPVADGSSSALPLNAVAWSISPLGPEWDSLTTSASFVIPSITVRVGLRHESKARAAPCLESCLACLRFLSRHPRYSQERLQLQLPLRFPLPDALTSALATGLSRLRALRLVRCNLTRELAGALGRMPCLRHLCISHANLAALPQLLEAAGQLEHLHVHGYHSLVIVEDNAHQAATWRAALGLLGRSRDRRGGHCAASGGGGGGGDSAEQWGSEASSREGLHTGAGGGADGSSSGGGGGGGGEGRLRCLAISAHHLYHDAVLDEAELEFEAEALRWQIRYDSADGDGGSGGGGANACERGAAGGCCHDPAAAAGGEASSGGYMGGGSGSASLCAAALVGIRCSCVWSAPASADGKDHAFTAAGASQSRPGPLIATGGPGRPRPALARAHPLGLQLLKSGKREVRLHPPSLLLDEVRQPHWRNLQYVQLALIPGPDPPPPPLLRSAAAPHAVSAAALGGLTSMTSVGQTLALPASAAVPMDARLRNLAAHAPAGPVEADGATAGAGLRQGAPAHGTDNAEFNTTGGFPHTASAVTLAPLCRLPSLTGLWLDPDEWDAAEGEEGQQQEPCGSTQPASTSTPGGAGAGTPEPVWRLVRVGDVWTRLHAPPSATAAHAAVQDAFGHVALLSGGAGSLRSLALGDHRQPFLGLGDDSAALLAALTALTKLHLAASYTLPLADAPTPAGAAAQGGGGACGAAIAAGGRDAWLCLPARLAPLGRLTSLQRLALHFANPLGRPAVVAAAALPTSLTSLALTGVVLRHGRETGSPDEACGSGRGLQRLRELCLTSSMIERPDLLGCGLRLRVLSLRDSGLGNVLVKEGEAVAKEHGAAESRAEPTGAVNGGAGGLPLASLLRGWHGVQTLRVVGTVGTSTDMRLPGEDRCLDWHSEAGLRALLACLPGLRCLQLGPPESACRALGSCPGGEAGGHERGALSQGRGIDSGLDPPSGSEAVLPRWRLTSLARGGIPFPAAAAVTELRAGAAAGAVECGPQPEPSSADTAAAIPAQFSSPPAEDVDAGAEPDWLLALLRLLRTYAPRLASLRVACASPDRDAGERSVAVAQRLLPAALPCLEQLSVVLDLALPYVLTQPQPEQCARGWAAWLRGQEEALQARMRFTCVSLSPHPNAASRARDAARAVVSAIAQQPHER